jgi:hypothetical protein
MRREEHILFWGFLSVLSWTAGTSRFTVLEERGRNGIRKEVTL